MQCRGLDDTPIVLVGDDAVQAQGGESEAVRRIGAAQDLAELAALEPPEAPQPFGEQPAKTFAAWLMWMVRRVELGDPALGRSLNLKGIRLQVCDSETQVLARLLEAVATNTALEELILTASALRGRAAAALLASALRRNCTLKVFSVDCNHLDPEAISGIFEALASNPGTKLEEIVCDGQFHVEQPTPDTFKLIAASLEKNASMRCLGLDMTDEMCGPHWRDQIQRFILRNKEAHRKARWLKMKEEMKSSSGGA